MSYLLDRKIKRGRYLKIAAAAILLAALLYFRSGIFQSLSYGAGKIFRPVYALGNGTRARTEALRSYFASKSSLVRENEALRQEILARDARLSDHDILLAENESLKTMLGRTPEEKKLVLGAILAKPNRSPYDTLLIDLGSEDGVAAGNLVFAEGDVPIGRIDSVSPGMSKVVLFSSSPERTQVVVPTSLGQAPSDIFLEIVGRGGGNFEMSLPRDFLLAKGDILVLPGHSSAPVAVTETILSDPRDPFKTVLLRTPLNIQDLKFVEVDMRR